MESMKESARTVEHIAQCATR